MTIRKMMHKKLIENGLWPDEATAVLDTAESDKTLEAMAGRWDEDAEGYPIELFASVWLAIKAITSSAC